MGKKYFIIDATCTTTGQKMGIQFEDRGNEFYGVGCVTVYGGGSGSNEKHNGKFLNGGTFRCKHCGTQRFVQCNYCGAFMCHTTNEVTCPGCGKKLHLITVTADEMPVTGADSKNQ